MSRAAPRLAFYGDDFTGATDALATAARAGLRTLLFFDVPTPDQLRRAGALDCLGIAGSTRAMPPDVMRAALLPVVAFLRALAPRVIHYKVCSTFDSAPQVGNMAVALEVLRSAAPDAGAAMIVGGQPSLGRYCLFGHLFAAAGDEVHRIDRHPTMSRHPVTPMGEADLRRHLADLGLADVVSVDYRMYAREARAALSARLLDLRSTGAVLFDVARAEDLEPVGAALAGMAESHPVLAAGPSSVIEALGSQWGHGAPDVPDGLCAAREPVLLLAGSLSPLTAQQVAAATSYHRVALDPVRLAHENQAYRDRAACMIARHLRQGHHVLACIENTRGGRTDGVHSHRLAHAGGLLLAAILREWPVRRLGVAGGDSSSLAMQALDAWGLSYLRRIAPGVALCRLHSDAASLDGMEVMLKGGQMGPVDLFERFVHGTA
ncbi:MAG: four-carbon acid sugar kinase family protein [Castellaniella sp.]|uniref:four-carbon acid sugar kinase family protein n=1 Tax=Castellaniella sp. TaxID=1955812 RepID=UPI003A8AFBFA